MQAGDSGAMWAGLDRAERLTKVTPTAERASEEHDARPDKAAGAQTKSAAPSQSSG